MARLRTDWILFLTIVAMVGFGLVAVYSASSAVAELRYHVPPYHFVVRQLIFAAVSFALLMYFKRRDYRSMNTPAWAFSGLGVVLGFLVVVYFVDSRTRVIAIIDDMKTFLGASFPKKNGRPIPNAFLVIDGEP
jgi:cell division protein FtsW (lipid II flippase)